MVAVELAADEPFFAEWAARAPQQRRSVARARLLGQELGLSWPLPVPVLSVVGSKGKGTAVAHAASALAAAGLQVGAVTSPPFRANTERIRVAGRALEAAEYHQLSQWVAGALARLAPSASEYLAPTGVFTVAGVAHLLSLGVQALVLEEGLGGRSDEISLFPAEVVVATPIFAEHLGIIGDSVAEVAADLLGVCGPTTRLLVSTAQSQQVRELLPTGPQLRYLPEIEPLFAERVPGLAAANAQAGSVAAQAIAAQCDRLLPSAALAFAAGRVQLPGRLSAHPGTAARPGLWVLDAAIDPVGVRAAVRHSSAALGPPQLVLACFPDSKDSAACFTTLSAESPGVTVLPVATGSHLQFTRSGQNVQAAEVALAAAQGHPGPVLCLGTMSFIGQATEFLDVQTTRWWD
jgi:folylpolyglutamate synthase/dihydropteroate synthase